LGDLNERNDKEINLGRIGFLNLGEEERIVGEYKSGRKEPLFERETTHKGWKIPLIQPRGS